MLEFDDSEDMSLLKDIGEKAHYCCITTQEDGKFHFHVMINYFEEIMSEEDEENVFDEDEKEFKKSLETVYDLAFYLTEQRERLEMIRQRAEAGDDVPVKVLRRQEYIVQGTGKIYRAVIDTEEKRRQLIVENTMSYAVWDKVIRRSLLTENEIVFPEGLAYEDIYFGSLLQLYAKRIAKMDRIYYHYFVNQKSTVLSRETGYHKDIMMVNQLVLQTYQERGMWERYHDELELDLLFTWYLATVKVICLRFDKPPYDMFCRLKEDILANMPGCVNNKYIKTSMREFHQLLMQLLTCYVTPSVLCRIAEQYRQYLQIDQK